VSLETNAIAVLVTEGKVRVDSPASGNTSSTATLPVLEAGQRAVVSLAPHAVPQVRNLDEAQMEDRLAWKPRLLDFNEAPLADIADEFNRHNQAKLIISDPSLRARKLSASFRSDNVEGFVRLMESDFGMVAEWPSGTEIVLRRAK
jgi:transmembrane sensor